MYENRPNTDMEKSAAPFFRITVPPTHFVPRKIQIFPQHHLKNTHKTHKIDIRIAHRDMGDETTIINVSSLRHPTIEKENGL